MNNNPSRRPEKYRRRMVVQLFLILNGILLFCFPEPAKAMLFPKASQPVVITPSPATKPSPTGMESSWRHFLQAYKNRNLQEIDTTFHRLLADRKTLDFANATVYSLALLSLAQQAHERHDETGAGTLIDQAAILSPDFSFPCPARSQCYFFQKHWLPSLHSCFTGTKLFFSITWTDCNFLPASASHWLFCHYGCLSDSKAPWP